MEGSIFRQYDIRGIFGKDLTIEVAEAIGRAYGFYLQKADARVSVGRDVRLSSGPLRDALVQGITSTGVNVVDIGHCPTPLQYFSLYHLDVDGGIMITGSHNPPEFNGFKISVGKETIYGEEIQGIRKIVASGQWPVVSKKGKIEYYDIIPVYIDYLKRQFQDSIKNPVKLAIDAGNGTAGLVAPELLRVIGCEVVELYCEPDGRFPHHHPDPTIIENLKDLIEVVKKERADFGVAYDGDGDRIGVVDEDGNIIWGDQLMIIFARDILEGQRVKGTGVPFTVKGQKGLQLTTHNSQLVFVGEVKCSQLMYDEIRRLGGNAIMWKTGHSLIKKKMKETGALLAGEMSGHIFFADRYFGYDDATYATCRLVEILSKQRLRDSGIRFSSLLSGLPKTYTTPEIRVDCPDEKKFGVVDRLSGLIGKDDMVRDIIRIDGLRLIFDGGWALIRASNTQPVLVLRFEATSEERLREIKGFLEERLRTVVSYQ
ncbi:MAG: phosphomannomutase/phosphoglucomutase [Deltaproteobacteria bacterium]|nr:phosphomannomutase/phosphoglucomutase [Deltaproteobacteria bacterium]